MSEVGESNGLSNAGISPRERLERIENMLAKIDEKLDYKADLAYVARIESRIGNLEGWRLKATGVFLVLVPIAGVVGAFIMKVLGPS